MTSLQETLRRRVMYLVVILTGIIGLFMASSMVFIDMASEAGEVDTARSIRASLVVNGLGLWTTASMFLAVFLGAIAVSSETTARTIVTVLSRPIDRTAYLTGRWIGILVFLWAFQLAGIALLLGAKAVLGASAAPTLWYGLADTLTTVTLLSGVGLALSVVLPPVVAGTLAFLLPILPDLIARATQHPRWLVKLPALAVYYLSPAAMPEDLVEASFSRAELDPQYGLYARVIVEHFLYAIVVFSLGCVLFARRELRLR